MERWKIRQRGTNCCKWIEDEIFGEEETTRVQVLAKGSRERETACFEVHWEEIYTFSGKMEKSYYAITDLWNGEVESCDYWFVFWATSIESAQFKSSF